MPTGKAHVLRIYFAPSCGFQVYLCLPIYFRCDFLVLADCVGATDDGDQFGGVPAFYHRGP